MGKFFGHFRKFCVFLTFVSSLKWWIPMWPEILFFVAVGSFLCNHIGLSRKSCGVLCEQSARSGLLSLWTTVDFLQRIVTNSSLLSEGDWDAIHKFYFTGGSFLAISEFMKKIQFRTSTSLVVKICVDVVCEKGNANKKAAQVLNANVVNEYVTPCLKSARNYLNCVFDGLVSSSVWNFQ